MSIFETEEQNVINFRITVSQTVSNKAFLEGVIDWQVLQSAFLFKLTYFFFWSNEINIWFLTQTQDKIVVKPKKTLSSFQTILIYQIE